MASNGVQASSLPVTNPTPQTIVKKSHPGRRRYRRCKSAPSFEIIPEKEITRGPRQLPKFIIEKVHPSLRQVGMFLAIYLTLGAVCFSLIGNQLKGKKTNTVLDSVYFCVVTMTTVGYGDIVPNSVSAKLLACAFVFSGMALVCLILSKAADYLVEKQEVLLVKALHINENVAPSEILKEVQTNRAKYKCAVILILLFMLMVTGVVFLYTVEKMDFIDAFYCVCSTITTLGYGDVSFSTRRGRVFAIFWIVISTLCLAQFFLSVAELNTERRQRDLVQYVMNRRITNMDLEAADMDEDGRVNRAEFLVYKLKEMGKINEDDITLVMEMFEDLDVDGSGSLSTIDVAIAQVSPPNDNQHRTN